MRIVTVVCWTSILALISVSANLFAAPESCHSVAFKGNLSAGNRYEQTLGGGLVFQLNPERFGPKGDIDGWSMSLVPLQRPNDDYIYPVNPPLRFNGLQLLAPAYGETTQESLGRPHDARFLLSQSDFDHISTFVTNALWPYSAPRPDKAPAEYVEALKKLNTGRLTLTIQDYAADPHSGSIQRIKFRVEIEAPLYFEFDSRLRAVPARCSASFQ